jgi:hypothetical protein
MSDLYRPNLCQSAMQSLWYVLDRAAQSSLQLLSACRVMGLNEPTPVQTPTTEPSRSIEFTMFMRAYQDMVFSTAARLAGNDAQAQDIAQDVFIKAYENFDHLAPERDGGGLAQDRRDESVPELPHALPQALAVVLGE